MLDIFCTVAVLQGCQKEASTDHLKYMCASITVHDINLAMMLVLAGHRSGDFPSLCCYMLWCTVYMWRFKVLHPGKFKSFFSHLVGKKLWEISLIISLWFSKRAKQTPLMKSIIHFLECHSRTSCWLNVLKSSTFWVIRFLTGRYCKWEGQHCSRALKKSACSTEGVKLILVQGPNRAQRDLKWVKKPNYCIIIYCKKIPSNYCLSFILKK